MTPEQLSRVRQHYHALSEVRDAIHARNAITNGYIDKGPVDIAQSELNDLQEIEPDMVPHIDLRNHRLSDGYNATSVLAHIGRVLGRVKAAMDSQDKSVVTQARRFSYVRNAELRNILERDHQEIQKSSITGCWKAVIILVGGCVEAILTDLLLADQKRSHASPKAPKDKQSQKEKEIHDWGFVHLIVVATDLGLIEPGVDMMSHSLREYRNLVHPSVEIRSRLKADEEEAKIAMAVLDMIHRDLSK